MIELRLGQQIQANPTGQRSNSPGEIVGYSSVYDSLSENLGGFKERVARTAFLKSLRTNADVRALINHDPNLVLGRVSNRTLRLSSDSKGLRMECTLPDVSYARDLFTSISRGDISSQSFSFICDPDGDSWQDELDPETNTMIPTRTLRRVTLLDCSAVLNPAYASSSVSAVPQFNSQPLDADFDASRNIPASCPMEFRNRILTAQQFRSKAAFARERIFRSILS